MGEPKPPIPDFAAMIRKLEREQQVLKTILTEQGVDLEPATPPSLRFAPGINRTWSTLWGRDGSSLRIVQVDSAGQVVTRPPRWELCKTIIKTFSWDDVGQERIIDFEKLVDYVHIFIYQSHFWAEFSSDGETWRNRRYAIPAFGFATVHWSYLSIFTRCRYVKLYSTYLGPVVEHSVIGEVFPTE